MNDLAFFVLVALFYVCFIALCSMFPWIILCFAAEALLKGHIGIAIFRVLLYFYFVRYFTRDE